jgi:hypothetical protein
VASHGFGVVVYSCYLFLFVACTIALGMVLGRYCVVSVGFSWYLNPPDSLVVGREGHIYVVDVPALLLLPSPNALYGNPHLLHTTQRPSHDPTQLVDPASSEVADFVGCRLCRNSNWVSSDVSASKQCGSRCAARDGAAAPLGPITSGPCHTLAQQDGHAAPRNLCVGSAWRQLI